MSEGCLRASLHPVASKKAWRAWRGVVSQVLKHLSVKTLRRLDVKQEPVSSGDPLVAGGFSTPDRGCWARG